MSDRLSAWSEAMAEDGTPAGMIHWRAEGEASLCGRQDGMYMTDLDMVAAPAAGGKAGYDVYPCAACCDRYRDRDF